MVMGMVSATVRECLERGIGIEIEIETEIEIAVAHRGSIDGRTETR